MVDNNGFANAERLCSSAGHRRRHKSVSLPACGLTVRIQSLKEMELAGYEAAIMSAGGRTGYRRDRLEDATRRLLVLCLVDAAGNRLFSDNDTHKLRDWDSLDTQCLYNECAAFCGLTRADIEDLVKNSEQTTVDATP